MESGRPGIVLSRARWDDDVRPDRTRTFIRCRTAAGPFSRQRLDTHGNQVYAVTKDGQRFLVTATPQKSSGAAPLTVVLNWPAAIHR